VFIFRGAFVDKDNSRQGAFHIKKKRKKPKLFRFLPLWILLGGLAEIIQPAGLAVRPDAAEKKPMGRTAGPNLSF